MSAMQNAMADGVELPYGKIVSVPDMAVQNGTAVIGIKYKSVEGATVDFEFAAMEFDRSGAFRGYATYNSRTSDDGALVHQGDSTGAEGEVSVQLLRTDDATCPCRSTTRAHRDIDGRLAPA